MTAMTKAQHIQLANSCGQGTPNDWELFAAVYDSLQTQLGDADVQYIKASDLSVTAPNDTVGRVIQELDSCPACPLSAAVWSGENSPPRTYRLSRGDNND